MSLEFDLVVGLHFYVNYFCSFPDMIIRARTSGTSIGSLKMWILSIFCFGLFFISSVNCLAVMSVDLGSEWMKIAVVSVRFQIILASKKSTDKYLLEALILATINPFI